MCRTQNRKQYVIKSPTCLSLTVAYENKKQYKILFS